MKLIKINFTIACLSVITIIDLIMGGGGLSLLLWVGYGLYSLDGK